MPVVTVAELIEFAPEFSAASNALITAKLTDAENRCPVGAWGSGEFRARGVKNKAAQALCNSPAGRDMRRDDGSTPWDTEVTKLNKIAACGLGRVSGTP